MNTKDIHKIELLLERYFDAETSLQEEIELKQFLQQENLPDSLKKYRELFNVMTVEAEIQLPKDKNYSSFSEQIIAEENAKLKFWKTANIRKIAAVLVIVISGTWFLNYQAEQQKKAEVRLAYEQTKAALELVSSEMNQGKKQLKHLNEIEEQTKPYFNLFN
ncbi:MAG: hypothetical protein ACQESK_07990 [Bacteroidota bacterium]